MFAVDLRQDPLIELLVRGGANVDAVPTPSRKTALHIAAQQGLDVTTLQILMDHGAELNARGERPQGETPLHIAAQHGQHTAVQFLLASGADVRACDANGETVLHRAAVPWEASVAMWLLDQGADIDATTHDDTTLSLTALCGENKAVEAKIQEGASSDDVNRALLFAAGGGHVGVMETLVRAGAYSEHEQNRVRYICLQRETRCPRYSGCAQLVLISWREMIEVRWP
ncbi:ankyrin [Aspergillus campestris IBT 28561]|uniref:Ankyrin n=1 Tax=Aspergillus campestris (strain IBT 28561) TaxID=1392248 RepID=A0A2I1CWI9_ASPC2|nr:ankyrin [Aspergillus campestris IBT 28561]PKY01982.1 ankyrin [Aspergillus campestris IBT 28561]